MTEFDEAGQAYLQKPFLAQRIVKRVEECSQPKAPLMLDVICGGQFELRRSRRPQGSVAISRRSAAPTVAQ